MPKVLVMEIGVKDPESSEFQPIVSFNYQIIDENKEMQQMKNVGRTVPFVTKDEYDFDKCYFENNLLISLRREKGELSESTSPMLYKRYSLTEAQLGCQHYIRGCQVVCPDCQEAFTCRFCHDEVSDHTLPFTDVTHVICSSCSTKQEKSQSCSSCGVVFGDYYCSLCALFDSLGSQAKPIFHSGGLCRVGVSSYYKNCTKCGQCIPKEKFEGHLCKQDEDCPVCLGPLRDSIYSKCDLPCGHQIHQHCLQNCYDDGNYTCPLCRKSTFTEDDLKPQKQEWIKWSQQIKVPFVFKGKYSIVSCNDCQNEFVQQSVNYGYLCDKCNSTNTFEKGYCTKEYFKKNFTGQMKEIKYDYYRFINNSLQLRKKVSIVFLIIVVLILFFK